MIEASAIKTSPMYFSAQAANLWTELSTIQVQLVQTKYRNIEDAANRAMQNVVRLAGILQSYIGDSQEISAQTLEAAWLIVQWHLGQFAQLFPPPDPTPAPASAKTRPEKQMAREIEDCQKIIDCIGEACTRNREADALKKHVWIRSGLSRARFETALARLVDEGFVAVSGTGDLQRLRFLPFGLGGPVGFGAV